MKAIVEPGKISGVMTAPPSKSITQRMLAAALLHTGKTIIHNAGRSEDEMAATRIIEELGAKVISRNNSLEVHSKGMTSDVAATDVVKAIHCGESGLSARLFTPLAALYSRPFKITGAGSLTARPMHFFGQILPQLGVTITDINGCLPLTVCGPLVPGSITVDGSVSSQFISGLLLAYAAVATRPVTITVTALKSKPYIDLTIDVLHRFGYGIEVNADYSQFSILPAANKNNSGEISVNVEGDWSSAAALLVAAAIAGSVTIQNLDKNSRQADAAITGILQNAGARVEWEGDAFSVHHAHLKAFEYDATDAPDLFPVLAILAACCKGESYISGIHRLFHKESNRAESIAEMLGNFGVQFSIEDDTLCITGVNMLSAAVIDSFHDHRIVMAATIASLKADGKVDILHADAVSKSYPSFFDDFSACGGIATLLP